MTATSAAYPYAQTLIPAIEDEALMAKHAREAKLLERMATAYSDNHRIKALPQAAYEKSLLIRPEGIREKLSLPVPPLNVEDGWAWAFPVIRGFLTADAAKRLGTYSVKANVVKFVDRNGKTWVSPCPSVLFALHKAGFREVNDPGINFTRGGQPTGIFNGENAGRRWKDLMDISRKEAGDLKAIEKAATNRIRAEIQSQVDSPMGGGNTP